MSVPCVIGISHRRIFFCFRFFSQTQIQFPFFFLSSIILVSYEDSQFEVIPLTQEKVLELIEQAYPNPITPEDLARYVNVEVFFFSSFS